MSLFKNMSLVLVSIFLVAVTQAKENGTTTKKTGNSTIANETLQKLMAHFSEGQSSSADSLIDISMIGRQEIIDAINTSAAKQKEIRVSFHDTNIQEVGKEVVVIKTDWEKRFLAVPQMTAGTKNGHTLFFMQKMKSGWKLVGQSGDNIFAP